MSGFPLGWRFQAVVTPWEHPCCFLHQSPVFNMASASEVFFLCFVLFSCRRLKAIDGGIERFWLIQTVSPPLRQNSSKKLISDTLALVRKQTAQQKIAFLHTEALTTVGPGRKAGNWRKFFKQRCNFKAATTLTPHIKTFANVACFPSGAPTTRQK